MANPTPDGERSERFDPAHLEHRKFMTPQQPVGRHDLDQRERPLFRHQAVLGVLFGGPFCKSRRMPAQNQQLAAAPGVTILPESPSILNSQGSIYDAQLSSSGGSCQNLPQESIGGEAPGAIPR